jgi:hypothetical protein
VEPREGVTHDFCHEAPPPTEEVGVLQLLPSIGQGVPVHLLGEPVAGDLLGGDLGGPVDRRSVVGDGDVVGPLHQGHVGDLVDLLVIGDPEPALQIGAREDVVSFDALPGGDHRVQAAADLPGG